MQGLNAMCPKLWSHTFHQEREVIKKDIHRAEHLVSGRGDGNSQDGVDGKGWNFLAVLEIRQTTVKQERDGRISRLHVVCEV